VANTKQDGEPLLRIAASHVGLRRGLRALGFMVAWDMCREALGHEPDVQEYAAWWKEATSTAYRDMALFKEAFPGEDTPSRLLDLAPQPVEVRSLGSLVVA
jgi:hypothetical protein